MNDKNLSDLILIGLAGIGAMAKYLDDYLRKKTPIIFAEMIATIFVGCFTGYMLATLVERYDPSLTKIAAGLGGMIGMRAMDFIIPMIEIALKKKPDDK